MDVNIYLGESHEDFPMVRGWDPDLLEPGCFETRCHSVILLQSHCDKRGRIDRQVGVRIQSSLTGISHARETCPTACLKHQYVSWAGESKSGLVQ